MGSAKEWIEDMRKAVTGKPQVDTAKHIPTTGEINNLVYLSCKYIAGFPMRSCDLAVVQIMGGKPESVDKLSEKFIPALAEYVWDHLMGEPDEVSVEDVEEAVKIMRDMLYTMDEKTRNCTEAVTNQ